MKTKRIYRCKNEELAVLCEFVLDSLLRDLEDFSKLSPIFNQEYVTQLKEDIQTCKALLTKYSVRGERAKTTELLVIKFNDLRTMIAKIESQFKFIDEELTMPVNSLGISRVRKSINKGNAEGVIENLKVLLQNIESNKAVLTAKVMDESVITDLHQILEQIDELNRKQNELMNQHFITTRENCIFFNNLWNKMVAIASAGKAMYRGVDEARLKTYTLKELIKRVRRNTVH